VFPWLVWHFCTGHGWWSARCTDKLSATYDPESQQVVSKQGSEVIVQSKEGVEKRRNVSDVKPLTPTSSQAVAFTDRPLRNRKPHDRYGVTVTH